MFARATVCASSAFWLTQAKPRPAGIMKPFWLPAMAPSTRHSSMRKSIEPIEDTPSTNSIAGCFAASIARRTAGMSVVTPVAVSFCTTITALMACEESCSSVWWMRSGDGALPHASSCSTTSRPSRCAMSIQRWLNWPNRTESTRSPEESVLASTASHAPVPDDGKMNVWPVRVLKTRFRSSNSGSVSSGKVGLRWSSIATCMARRMRSGTLVGPGTCRKWRPGI